MPRNSKNKNNGLTKLQDIQMDNIKVFFKRSILKSIVKILLMEHSGFRTVKAVKNINRLFTNLDLIQYQNNPELISYIWCICFISKQWLDGIIDPEIIAEGAKRQTDYDNIKGDIISTCMNDKNIITAPEAKAIFDLVGEALQYGYITKLKDEYINLLEDVDLNNPSAFKELVDRLFNVSKSLLDIQHNTNLIANKVTFDTSDSESIKEALSSTIESLSGSSNMLKVGIRRLNTLLSPAYMNGRLYVYAGVPSAGKSIVLLKSALDIRKYNPGFVAKTPGMRPCVLYITMENTFTETIERIWNMSFDDPITNYSPDEAFEKLAFELGILTINDDNTIVKDNSEFTSSLEAELSKTSSEEDNKQPNIEIVIKYFPYRGISTDDLSTMIYDLRDEGMEVCALILDYIKRIRPSNTSSGDTVKTELGRIVNELKAIAVIDDIPLITAHQLNRAATAVMDAAARSGKSEGLKLVGRENIGDAYEVIESADTLIAINSIYKPGTDEKYMEFNALKRRRLDSSESEFARYTYLAHPFARNNGLRLLDDMHIEKVLSLQSLTTDVDTIVGKEKANAVPRLKQVLQSEFIELDTDDEDI